MSNLETGEPLWFGAGRKKETLDEFFRNRLSTPSAAPHRGSLRGHVGAIRASIEQWAPDCAIVYDKFHIMQHVTLSRNPVPALQAVRGRIDPP